MTQRADYNSGFQKKEEYLRMSQLALAADRNPHQVVVQPVTSWWQRRQFLNVPWDIYSGDLNWVPPLRGNAKEMVNYTKHPFYDTAEIQTFLAYRNGTPVGRIAAIVNRAHNERYHEQRGFFGFFESEDSQETASALFDAARDWRAISRVAKSAARISRAQAHLDRERRALGSPLEV